MRLLFAIATVCTAATLVACGSGTSSTKTPTATVTAASSSPTRVASPSASASTATVAIAATEAPPATSAATIAAEPTVAPPPVVVPTDTAPRPPPAATATDVPPPSSSTFTVVGQNLLFNLTQLNAAAGAPVTIVFDNEDSAVAHNIHFFSGASSSGTSVGATDIIAGPSTATLSLGVLAAGSYFYHCDVHPVQMQGHLTVS